MENKTTIMIYLDKEVKEKLKKLAITENRSMSNLVATIVFKYINKNEEIK